MVRYVNNSGRMLVRRNGQKVPPGVSFTATEYEPADAGFTVVSDETPAVVRHTEEFSASATPRQIDIPGPFYGPLMEVTVQAVSDDARIEVGFNRPEDPKGVVDAYTRYAKCVDTRRVRNLQISGTGTARVILSEVIGG